METKEPRAMEEIHQIRIKLYEEEKKNKVDFKMLAVNRIAEEFARKYNLESRLFKRLSMVK